MGRVKLHKNLNSPRSKTREATEEVEKNSNDSENKERRKLPITVNKSMLVAPVKQTREIIMKTKAAMLRKKLVRIKLIMKK